MNEAEVELDVSDCELGPDAIRAVLGQALSTTDENVLRAASASFKGIFPSEERYLLSRLRGQLPGNCKWIAECVDLAKFRAAFGRRGRAFTTVPHPEQPNCVLVFEPREDGQR